MSFSPTVSRVEGRATSIKHRASNIIEHWVVGWAGLEDCQGQKGGISLCRMRKNRENERERGKEERKGRKAAERKEKWMEMRIRHAGAKSQDAAERSCLASESKSESPQCKLAQQLLGTQHKLEWCRTQGMKDGAERAASKGGQGVHVLSLSQGLRVGRNGVGVEERNDRSSGWRRRAPAVGRGEGSLGMGSASASESTPAWGLSNQRVSPRRGFESALSWARKWISLGRMMTKGEEGKGKKTRDDDNNKDTDNIPPNLVPSDVPPLQPTTEN
ncbi:hypothetical protein GALMADRAFT_215029 [Galerina marginata CBS 339.88]|uniref:Uncharacterized protein n=1 Tax=Galerina marginata (strain CBS 339.88) TaxID=685588 RepID=A0A067SI14_GALM3|nr:hypothetical protein GALMADRAFT_215029 [Galerina marginata CBS 339.88]